MLNQSRKRRSKQQQKTHEITISIETDKVRNQSWERERADKNGVGRMASDKQIENGLYYCN